MWGSATVWGNTARTATFSWPTKRYFARGVGSQIKLTKNNFEPFYYPVTREDNVLQLTANNLAERHAGNTSNLSSNKLGPSSRLPQFD